MAAAGRADQNVAVGSATDYCDQFQCCFRDDGFRFVKD